MGGKQRTVKNVWVYKIDPARNLMWVKGQVIVFTCLLFALIYELGDEFELRMNRSYSCLKQSMLKLHLPFD